MSNQVGVKEAIQSAGGPAIVAKLVGVSVDTVYKWQSKKRVGPKHYLAFLDMCKAARIRVDAVQVMKGVAESE